MLVSSKCVVLQCTFSRTFYLAPLLGGCNFPTFEMLISVLSNRAVPGCGDLNAFGVLQSFCTCSVKYSYPCFDITSSRPSDIKYMRG